MKDIPHVERPRERLSKYGPDKLSDAELLAIILKTGTKDLNVLKLSQKILQKFSGDAITKTTVEELKSVHGLGEVKALEIIACFELGRRFLQHKKTSVILSPRDVWERMEDVRSSKKEHFVVFYLDSRNQEIKKEIISIGTLNESHVHPREVFESAIKNNASSIIVAHNHPSGDAQPSQDDIEITKRLISAGKVLGIELISHVIVTKTGQKEIFVN